MINKYKKETYYYTKFRFALSEVKDYPFVNAINLNAISSILIFELLNIAIPKRTDIRVQVLFKTI